jgi:putative transposase
VSPQAKRNAVKQLIAKRRYSERGACQLIGINRSSARYISKEDPEEIAFSQSVRKLAHRHPGYGYRRIAVLLKREGSQVNHKRVQRVWRVEGLQLPRRKPCKRRYGPKGDMVHKAEFRNHVWSYDFLEENLQNGKRVRILVVIDEYTREFLAYKADRSFTSEKVIHLLDWLFRIYGPPKYMRSDNGPEFIAHNVQHWLAEQSCKTLYIHPGSPWENGYVESFIGKFRMECLNRYLFFTFPEIRTIIETWRDEYNHFRPHSALDYLSPSSFAAKHSQTLLQNQAEHIRV